MANGNGDVEYNGNGNGNGEVEDAVDPLDAPLFPGRLAAPRKEALEKLAFPRRYNVVRGNRRGRQFRMARYLVTLSKTGHKGQSREAAGVKQSTIGIWRRLNIDGFADREYEAEQMACDHLEDIALERAIAGSDVLLMHRLNGLRSDRYKYGGGGGRQQGPEDSEANADSVARAMRRLWEHFGDYCPPDPGLGASDVVEAEVVSSVEEEMKT